MAEAERAYELNPRSFLTLYTRVFVRLLAGDTDGALAPAQTEQLSHMVLAIAANMLGRADEAIAYAIEFVACCDNTEPFRTREPFFSAAFRAHPRYPELLRAVGL